MAREDLAERLVAAATEIDRVTPLLTVSSAVSLDDAAARLETIAFALEAFRRQLRPGRPDPAARHTAEQLRACVGRSRRILNGAAEFFDNWNRRLGAITGGYTKDGEPAGIVRPSRVSLQG
jgi:hypothetical protein